MRGWIDRIRRWWAGPFTQSVTDSHIAGGVTQVRDVTGDVRIGSGRRLSDVERKGLLPATDVAR
jgi:hypothetical protein